MKCLVHSETQNREHENANMAKLSRQALAERSIVAVSMIKKFETTGQISSRHFLLWLTLDSLN